MLFWFKKDTGHLFSSKQSKSFVKAYMNADYPQMDSSLIFKRI